MTTRAAQPVPAPSNGAPPIPSSLPTARRGIAIVVDGDDVTAAVRTSRARAIPRSRCGADERHPAPACTTAAGRKRRATDVSVAFGAWYEQRRAASHRRNDRLASPGAIAVGARSARYRSAAVRAPAAPECPAAPDACARVLARHPRRRRRPTASPPPTPTARLAARGTFTGRSRRVGCWAVA
jgi:hypothetical protein